MRSLPPGLPRAAAGLLLAGVARVVWHATRRP